ncbi:unnamed protein product [Phytophthora lilii]|uniref:Unnamed protein product n=1 Tax=Phytophthora lilii TaxID=2077276 RepID=A0A9W6TRA7_9STRA|nr:unnamed protein product [Phytophthora lilii]
MAKIPHRDVLTNIRLVQDEEGRTLLHLAIQHGLFDAIDGEIPSAVVNARVRLEYSLSRVESKLIDNYGVAYCKGQERSDTVDGGS